MLVSYIHSGSKARCSNLVCINRKRNFFMFLNFSKITVAISWFTRIHCNLKDPQIPCTDIDTWWMTIEDLLSKCEEFSLTCKYFQKGLSSSTIQNWNVYFLNDLGQDLMQFCLFKSKGSISSLKCIMFEYLSWTWNIEFCFVYISWDCRNSANFGF